MFSSLFQVIGFAVGFVYPLNETYKILLAAEARNQQVAQQLLQSVSGKVPINTQEVADMHRWFTYWLVVALFQFVKATKLVTFIGNLIPFQNLVFLYLRIWMVAPLVDINGCKYTGSQVLYQFYLSKWLAALNFYIGNMNMKDLYLFVARLYNYAIANYFPNLAFMKVDTSGSSFGTGTSSAQKEKSLKDLFQDYWKSNPSASSVVASFPLISSLRSDSGSQATSTAGQVTELYNEFFPHLLLQSLWAPISPLFHSSSSQETANQSSAEIGSRGIKDNVQSSILEGFDIVSRDELNKVSSTSDVASLLTSRLSKVVNDAIDTNSIKERVVSGSSISSLEVVTPPTPPQVVEQPRRSSWFGWSRSTSTPTSPVTAAADKPAADKKSD